MMQFIFFLMVLSVWGFDASTGSSSTSSWPLTFTIISTDESSSSPKFWGQLKIGDPELLPVHICGGWDMTVTFNQDVQVLSNPSVGYREKRSTPTRHIFRNKEGDSVYIIEATGDKYVNFEASTADLDTLNAISAVLEDVHHPSVRACDGDAEYDLTSPRWSAGSGTGGFSARITMPVVDNITHGWRIRVIFSEPLTQFSMGSNVNITRNGRRGGTRYAVINCCTSNAQYSIGEEIELEMTVQYHTLYCPDYCAEFATGESTTYSPSSSISYTTTTTPATTTSTSPSPFPQTVTTPVSNQSHHHSIFTPAQTIVIAIGPSVFAVFILSVILSVYYCLVKPKEDEIVDLEERILELENRRDANSSGISSVSTRSDSGVAVEVHGDHGYIGSGRGSERKISSIAVLGVG